MATAVLSGRVDVRVRDKAGAYLEALGLTPADVIRSVWESIARTGKVPVAEEEPEESETDPWEAFVAFCNTLPEPASDWLATLTDDQMKDMIASRYE